MADTPSSGIAPRPREGHLSVRSAGKIYDPGGAAVEALHDFSLEIAPGDFVAIVGPSGCGKSTLMNVLAGFDDLTSGAIYVDGKLLADAQRRSAPGPDRVVVFQHGALFPWKTVLDNVTYGLLKSRKVDKAAAERRARAVLEGCGGLHRMADSYPAQLSSGMQRRVEICRALVNEPKMLLLDEPFRAMDTVSKATMHRHLLEVYSAYRRTIVFITHDLEEAIYLADTVIVMSTRPGTVKMRIEVDLPRPRVPQMVTSGSFMKLKERAIAAVHEEAKKAFERGERELA